MNTTAHFPDHYRLTPSPRCTDHLRIIGHLDDAAISTTCHRIFESFPTDASGDAEMCPGGACRR
jgi:hypothetical protein